MASAAAGSLARCRWPPKNASRLDQHSGAAPAAFFAQAQVRSNVTHQRSRDQHDNIRGASCFDKEETGADRRSDSKAAGHQARRGDDDLPRDPFHRRTQRCPLRSRLACPSTASGLLGKTSVWTDCSRTRASRLGRASRGSPAMPPAGATSLSCGRSLHANVVSAKQNVIIVGATGAGNSSLGGALAQATSNARSSLESPRRTDKIPNFPPLPIAKANQSSRPFRRFCHPSFGDRRLSPAQEVVAVSKDLSADHELRSTRMLALEASRHVFAVRRGPFERQFRALRDTALVSITKSR